MECLVVSLTCLDELSMEPGGSQISDRLCVLQATVWRIHVLRMALKAEFLHLTRRIPISKMSRWGIENRFDAHFLPRNGQMGAKIT